MKVREISVLTSYGPSSQNNQAINQTVCRDGISSQEWPEEYFRVHPHAIFQKRKKAPDIGR
ncbi:MAG: hypothetical protein O8C61_12330 [Candidatus Methanoperedens sp.]|nr:hypothetical protein [Candidatus Methanoperedens sp.]